MEPQPCSYILYMVNEQQTVHNTAIKKTDRKTKRKTQNRQTKEIYRQRGKERASKKVIIFSGQALTTKKGHYKNNFFAASLRKKNLF